MALGKMQHNGRRLAAAMVDVAVRGALGRMHALSDHHHNGAVELVGGSRDLELAAPGPSAAKELQVLVKGLDSGLVGVRGLAVPARL
eukprot:9654130-Alexandrium_andersonii.AAC.1